MVEHGSAVVSSTDKSIQNKDLGSLLLSVYQCLTEPDHFHDMTEVLTSWLDAEEDPVLIVQFERHASDLWDNLSQSIEAKIRQEDQAELVFSLTDKRPDEDLEAYLDQMQAEDAARTRKWIETDHNSNPNLLVRIYQNDAEAARVACIRKISHEQAGLFLTAEEFEETVSELFSTNFSLTSREVLVLKKLVRGQSPKQIAESEGKSWETVRSQIKSITSKLGASSQSDLMRMAAETMAVATEAPKTTGPEKPSQPDTYPKTLMLRDGRKIQYEVDNPSGTAILLYSHCLTTGRHWSARARALAKQADFTTVRISRAAFAASTINQKTGSQLLLDHAHDCAEVLRAEDIGSCMIFAVGMGLPSAYKFAVLFPELVSGIVALDGPPPILSKADASDLKGIFKAGALANLYAPTSAKLVANFAFRHLSKRDGIDLKEPLAMPGFDLTELEDEDGCKTYKLNNHDSMLNKGQGYWREASYATVDWAELPKNANHRPKVRLIQSTNSPYIGLKAAQNLADRLNAPLRTIDTFLPMISGPFGVVYDELRQLSPGAFFSG